jgi:hypothetical protein
MKKNVLLLVLATSLAMTAATLRAEPPAKTRHRRSSTTTQKSGGQNTTRNALLESANGWTYAKGVWTHPEGYKFVNGKILRTTAKEGKAVPKPPGKLALENAEKLSSTAPTNPRPNATEKAAETRQRNLSPIAAPQTGTHL